MRLSHWLFSTLVLLATLAAAQAADQPATSAKSGPMPPEVIELTLRPAPAPQPALKHCLLPGYLERTPGNAMPIYAKVFVLLADRRLQEDKGWEKITKWNETPVEKLPLPEVREMLRSFHSVLRETDIAARRERCDWDPPIREEGEEIFGILLPELQAIRSVARLVALRTRLHIAEQKYDEALASLRTGYAMARHVAEQPFLVSSLVGVAVASMMTHQLQALENAPGAPNLYWAITALPRPLIDVHKAMELEGSMLYAIFPEMAPSRRRDFLPAQAEATVAKMLTVLAPAVAGGAVDSAKLKELLATRRFEAVAANAKAELIAAGRPKDKVDAMSPTQATVLRIFELYEAQRDDLFRWFAVPYWQACPRIEQASAEIKAASKHPEVRALAELLLPAVGKAYFAQVRIERHLAALRCVEAVRLHAACRGGQLPAALDEIREVPVPVNPVTGQAFSYRREGGTAILDADGESPQRFRLKLVK
jgi:hypothetical protein